MILKTLTSDKTNKLEDIFHSHPTNRRSASTNQRRSHIILMDGGDQYTKGIVSAYCQFRGWVLTSAMDFSDAMRRCDGLDVHAVVLNLGTLNNKDLAESLSRFRSGSSIPVFTLVESSECDQVKGVLGEAMHGCFIKPLDAYQLDHYLGTFMDSPIGFQERRKSERRSRIDRRNPTFAGNPPGSETLQRDKTTLAPCIVSGAFRVDLSAKKATMADRTLDLTPREFKLVSLFLSNPGRVFSAEELLELAWPSANNTANADLYQYIYRIRQKIEKNPKEPRRLLTVRGFGYTFRDDGDRSGKDEA